MGLFRDRISFDRADPFHLYVITHPSHVTGFGKFVEGNDYLSRFQRLPLCVQTQISSNLRQLGSGLCARLCAFSAHCLRRSARGIELPIEPHINRIVGATPWSAHDARHILCRAHVRTTYAIMSRYLLN